MRVWTFFCASLLAMMGMSASAQTVVAPLRAEIVSPAEISTTAVEATEGSFGQIGVPKSGFCQYGFDSQGAVTVTDSTGTYGAGEVTPDGCYAGDEAQAAAFEIACAKGDTLDLKINARSDAEGIEISMSDIAVEGGELESLGDRYRLICTSEAGRVVLRAGTNFTLSPSAATGDGAFGALELETEY